MVLEYSGKMCTRVLYAFSIDYEVVVVVHLSIVSIAKEYSSTLVLFSITIVPGNYLFQYELLY